MGDKQSSGTRICIMFMFDARVSYFDTVNPSILIKKGYIRMKI
jgi:hypothetical protein